MTGRDWATIFNEEFDAPVSPVAARIWREVFGDEYPANLDIYSFVSISELNRFVTELRLSPGDVLADVGCGRGGPGLWVATQTGARLIGIDIAKTALDAARGRALAVGIAERAEFHRGSFEDTGLSNTSINAVMSVDALLFAPIAIAVRVARYVTRYADGVAIAVADVDVAGGDVDDDATNGAARDRRLEPMPD